MPARRGVLVFLVLFGLFGVVVLLGALRLRAPTQAPSGPTVITFDVPSDVDESEPPYRPFAFGRLRRESLTLYDLVSTIRQAAEDDHVRSLVLHLDQVRWGWAKLAEVRDAVQAFRGAGKSVYASLTMGAGEPEYLLASAADVLSMPPTSSLGLNGLSLTVLFLRGTFDKLGVTPNFEHVGQYKSAIEVFTRTGLSPPARAAMQAVLDDHWRLLVDSLASARDLSPRVVARLLDDGPFTASEARARGLLDTLLYDAEVDSLALRRAGKHAATVSLARYLERQPEPGGGKHIA